jgi:S-methylmethionine-dependent homocysteine/selenocysteine methylase
MNRLRNNKKETLILDGGTGEELFLRGVPDDRKIWSATAIVQPQYHSTLQQVHASFVEAGADAITTNSYGIVPGVGFSIPDIKQHVATAGRLARECVPKSTLVFGSLGPLVESYRADLIMAHKEGVAVYTEMSRALSPFVDCFLGETMSCYEESVQVLDAVQELDSTDVRPVMISFTLDGQGNFRSGETVVNGMKRLLEYGKTRNQVKLLAILFNCSEPEAITRALERIREDSSLQHELAERCILLGAYANRLTPVDPDWTMESSDGPQPMRNDLSPQEYCDKFVVKWINDLSVQIIGGCCGITPEHISYIRSKIRTQPSSL